MYTVVDMTKEEIWWTSIKDELKQKLCDQFCFTNRNGYQFFPWQTLTTLDVWRIYHQYRIVHCT